MAASTFNHFASLVSISWSLNLFSACFSPPMADEVHGLFTSVSASHVSLSVKGLSLIYFFLSSCLFFLLTARS